MEAFVSRKRRRLSPGPITKEEIGSLSVPDDDDSTDFKLAILASLHPSLKQQTLLEVLLEHEGSVEAASASLITPVSLSPKKPLAAAGYQSSLASFAVLSETVKRPKLLLRKGKTLHLHSPVDVAKHTPCSIIHNFLPTKDANDLLVELLGEAASFETITFKLFDNIVQSPHTSCFYVDSLDEVRRQKTEYVYNGGQLNDVREITPHMRRVSALVKEAVNIATNSRIKHHYPDGRKLQFQPPDPWTPNSALVNCYSSAQESVGWHSDQLTYLGPRATIGSLSLGVTREFRVRHIIPQDSDTPTSSSKTAKNGEDLDATGQISIHLPHNSLLIMHAEMQEEWKHSISPAIAIDPHPISGNKRINITYRDYKADLHPRFTPRCRCGIPCVLRVVQRRKENHGRYFWMCSAGSVPGKEGCTFFQWAEFDDDGHPMWKKAAG